MTAVRPVEVPGRWFVTALVVGVVLASGVSFLLSLGMTALGVDDSVQFLVGLVIGLLMWHLCFWLVRVHLGNQVVRQSQGGVSS